MSAVPDITAEWLLARVRDNGEGCLVWTGYSQGGHPKCNFGQASENKPLNVRRVIWKAMTGKAPRRDRIYVSICETPDCVDPAHIRERLHGHRNKGRKQTLVARAAMSAVQRAKSHLTREAIEDMKAKRMTQEEYADLYGITQSMVSKIQLGLSWVDFTNNPFNQLLGAR